MKFKAIEILPLYINNYKGIHYDLNAAEKIISEFKRTQQNLGNYFGCCEFAEDYIQYGDPDVINIKNIGFAVSNVRIIRDSLVADIAILETPKGKQLKDLMQNVVFRTCVWGFIDNGKVLVERLVSINSINKDRDSFQNMSQ